jgi:molybdopterin converting factor small subunit
LKQKIELYGRLREVASTQTVELSVDTPCTIAEALTALVREYPALADTLPRVACAVGDEMRTRQDILQGDETLVLLPPVSGG